MDRKRYDLVYQGGIANVFRCTLPFPGAAQTPHYERVAQSSYEACEWFCRGVIEAGAEVSVWHSDVAGDVLIGTPWQEGPGTMFRESKRPPAPCIYADV